MDWGKTKTILILIFLALNIFLLCNVFMQESKVISVTQKDISDMQAILKQSNIELKSSIPNKIKQKPFLKVEDLKYDEKDIVNRFLGDINQTTKIDGLNYVTYKNGPKSLEIYSDKRMVYKNSEPSENLEGFEKKKVIKYIEKHLKEKGINLKHGIIEDYQNNQDGYKVRYVQKYKDYQIFVSYMDITISNKGVTQIDWRWVIPIEFVDTPKDIKTPTEILFVFAKDLENKDTVDINNVLLGYYFPLEDFNNAVVSAVPVWAIELSNGKIYYYNAYEGYLEGKQEKI